MLDVAFSEIVRNWAIVLAGVIGVGIAFWRAFAHSRQADAQIKQAQIQQRAHITELFGKAVERLRDEKLEIRLGALYTLMRIARDFPEFADQIVALLTTYVRERTKNSVDAEQPTDIVEIVEYLVEASKARPIAQREK